MNVTGKADAVTKTYMQDAEVFADAFNYYIYGGEQVIHPDQLHELDTAELVTSLGDNAQVQVYRDVLKYVTAMEDGHFTYLILGVENQTGVHYAMPVRNMLYDALQYHAQAQAIARKYRKGGSDKVLSKEEYLSGFGKDDKLLPVITLVVYFGAKAWDGPKSLHEMLTIPDARALTYVTDYKLNLLEPAAMSDEDIAKLKSDLKSVFYFIKYSRDKEKLQAVMEADEEFRNMRRSTAEVIDTVTSTGIHLPEGKERIDMCLAIEQIREESIALGEARGIALGEARGIALGEARGIALGEARGEARGREEGAVSLLAALVRDGILSVSDAAARAHMTEEQFKARIKTSGHTTT